ncbi:V-set and immunoglobulin domain-containing protein 1 isoform X2 [Oreochromis niloticus]|uniref:V-set and immunoglobulin domain-containing protein 1 isoform X2 n=1 Tax=Oreochromis niloticus TaxID=8128 RepID=UPI000904ABCD|nr:V-set and immunoglobulin domain-containing protein 1 isoform X2 [Oreochromis niloticus]
MNALQTKCRTDTESQRKKEKKNYQKIITAESGQNVMLPCRAPNENKTNTVVEWSRPDLNEEYVLLHRGGHFDPASQHPSFKNRVELQDRQMKDGDVSLILKDVTTADSGTYECRIRKRVRSILEGGPISSIYLSVVPPGQTGGHTEDGGKSGSVGLIVGLSVVVFLVVVVVVFVIYRRYKQQSLDSHRSNAEPTTEMSEV